MLIVADVPAWLVDVLARRARTLDITLGEAIATSVNSTPLDQWAETIGWAVETQHIPPREAASRGFCSYTLALDAARRYRALHGPNRD